MNYRPGAIAVIRRPWQRDQDIGLMVTLVQRGFTGEVRQNRGGGYVHCVGPGDSRAWLCDASGPEFPCFIAERCLRLIDGGDGEDETLTWAGKPAHVPRQTEETQ